MSVEDIKKLKADKGFTIVELLIVIVVIGILVAIVIVAYTGITQSARNSGFKADASSIQKLAEAYNAEVGSYPSTHANFTSTSYSGNMPANMVVAPTTGTVTNQTTTSSGATAPTLGAQTWARHVWTNGSTVTTYISVRTCTGGLNVYFPQDGGSLGTLRAGAGC